MFLLSDLCERIQGSDLGNQDSYVKKLIEGLIHIRFDLNHVIGLNLHPHIRDLPKLGLGAGPWEIDGSNNLDDTHKISQPK